MKRVSPKKIEPLQDSIAGTSTIPTPGTSVPLQYTAGFWVTAAIILGALLYAYWNHFDNEFEFDDEHCIVQNSALDTMNVGAFFTDASTFSTLPANQAWRPGITILNSIDTIRSKDRIADPAVFHQHIFVSYILLGVLVFFMFLYLLREVFPAITWTNWAALLSTGLFLLHTANAETINYIIARSDSQSTLFIVLAMVMFMYSAASRKYFLYIIPMAIGFLVKESAIMVAPLLLVYCWLFTPKFSKNLVGIALAFVVAAVLYLISRAMTPDTWISGGQSPFMYLCTEAFVIVHYFFTFFFPVGLSADSDWSYVTDPFDTRVIAGAFFIVAMIWLAIRWSRNPETRLATFGIFWFFIALAPTSSLFPFAEVLNDHRIFFPFIGLVMVAANFLVLAYRKFELLNYSSLRFVTIAFVAIVLIGHTMGTRVRCEVWDNGESLWKDVTEKSPKNPRGWMNYGLAIMPRNLDSAIILFDKTLSITPYYVYARINMGVAQDRKGNLAEAEAQYKMAMLCDSTNPEALYFYGEWLVRHERVQEGLVFLRSGHRHSPGHTGINSLLAIWDGKTYGNALQLALETADKNPTPENLLSLSLAWYQAGEYLQCVRSAEQATAIKPDYALAWNNICAGYNKLGEFDKAIEAGQKAVALTPDDLLANGNLNAAVSEKNRFEALTTDAKKSKNYDKWINLSLEWYKAGNFLLSRSSAEEAVKVNASDATGWNNVCAAANRTGEFDIAVQAGEKAVELKPDWELAKNNLAEAKRLKEQASK